MSDNLNTARLPQGRKVDKNAEITPDPAVLARTLYTLTVRGSGLVLGYDRRGNVVARYMDEEFAREEVEEAGLKWDELLAPNRLKQEQAEAKAARRTMSPNRRLRSERRAARGGRPPSPRPSPPGEGETSAAADEGVPSNKGQAARRPAKAAA